MISVSGSESRARAAQVAGAAAAPVWKTIEVTAASATPNITRNLRGRSSEEPAISPPGCRVAISMLHDDFLEIVLAFVENPTGELADRGVFNLRQVGERNPG